MQNEDSGWEERVKRKSLIELVPVLTVVTPSPSCSSESPPPSSHRDDPMTCSITSEEMSLPLDDDDSDSGRITPKAEELHTGSSENLSDGGNTTDSSDMKLCTSSNSSSTLTMTSCTLPRPDVIPDVQIIRTKGVTPKLDVNREYFSLDTVLLGSSGEEQSRSCQKQQIFSRSDDDDEAKMDNKRSGSSCSDCSEQRKTKVSATNGNSMGVATSGRVRGARVVLDANGEIIFSSETLKRKRRQKVSFDPGSAVKNAEYDAISNYSRTTRESVYDVIKKPNEKLYECIEEIRKQNLKAKDPFMNLESEESTVPTSGGSVTTERASSSASNGSSGTISSSCSSSTGRAKVNILLETDLDSAIPPEMPELKNLPKIKDRLKRNESYRIANTDEIQEQKNRKKIDGGAARRSPLSLLHYNEKNHLKMKFLGSGFEPNKKRDIPEEDPVFVQQMLNAAASTNGSSNTGTANSNGNSPGGVKSPISSPMRRQSPLSKFALTPEDKPSFLRRGKLFRTDIW